MNSLEGLADTMLPIAIFVFLAVAVWRDRRAKEHEVTERHATYRKVIESGSADRVIELMEHDRRHGLQKQARDKQLGGMIVTAIGVIAIVVLYLMEPDGEPVFLLGVFPMTIGLLLLVHARALRLDGEGPGGPPVLPR
jgi:hypothetical protein